MSVAGVLHFVQPKFFEKIMPRVLGLDEHSRLLVYASGVAELTCAGLLAMPRTRRIGGWATAGLLVAVFPANIQNALDDGGLFWARLPLQAPLVVWAADIARTNAHRMKTAELARPGPPE